MYVYHGGSKNGKNYKDYVLHSGSYVATSYDDAREYAHQKADGVVLVASVRLSEAKRLLRPDPEADVLPGGLESWPWFILNEDLNIIEEDKEMEESSKEYELFMALWR